jgi:hypothetical protein
MKGKKTTGGPEKGVYEVYLEAIQCAVSENFNTKDPEILLTFVWNLGENPNKPNEDLTFFDYVTLYQDDEGYPVIGGKGGKMYKRMSGLSGKDFNPAEEEDWEIVFPKQYDDPEKILNMPMQSSYGKDDTRLEVRSLKFRGVELIGKECQIELGNAKKPDGTYSDKISVINCMPLAKRNARRNRQEANENDERPVPAKQRAAAPADDDDQDDAPARPVRRPRAAEPVDEEVDEEEVLPV